MGIVNITTDSFYAGSRSFGDEEIAARARRLADEGADILDIGAYSSRPGAGDVPEAEESARLERALAIVRESVPGGVLLSVDTFRARVAAKAVGEWGADIINDISGTEPDEGMAEVVASLRCPYILMHKRGTPADMQEHTDYGGDVTASVLAELGESIARMDMAGAGDIIADPGFGFSKTLEQNYELLRNLGVFRLLHKPILVGLSRKSMATKLLGIDTADALNATTALNVMALERGADILRVHDVAAAREAVALFMMMTQQESKFSCHA